MRAASLTLFSAVAFGLATESARAQLPVAPAPRAIRPDGTVDPAPKPEAPPKAEDPAVVVDRIIKNSKDVGDRLEKKDAGTDTRGTQDKILKDIDALINRQENPPPPQPDPNKDKDKDKDKEKDKNKDPMMKDMPPPKMGDMPMDKMGMGMGKDGMPMAGMNDPPPMPMGGTGRKPRVNDPMNDGKKEQGDPMPDPKGGPDKKPGKPDPKDAKGQPGGNAGNPDGKGGKGGSTLPVNDDVAKEVWGHLPDKLRQQMTQYYKEDVMPKYAELLKQYYSSLSEKGAPVVPKK